MNSLIYGHVLWFGTTNGQKCQRVQRVGVCDLNKKNNWIKFKWINFYCDRKINWNIFVWKNGADMEQVNKYFLSLYRCSAWQFHFVSNENVETSKRKR